MERFNMMNIYVKKYDANFCDSVSSYHNYSISLSRSYSYSLSYSCFYFYSFSYDSFFIEFWKRTQSTIAMKWGVEGTY